MKTNGHSGNPLVTSRQVGEAQEMGSQNSDKIVTIAGVRLTNPGRVLFAEQGITKHDLADYFDRMAEPILARTANRLISLVRCPRGHDGECFFQRHGGSGLPDSFRTLPVRQKDGTTDDYLYITGKAGLVGAAQVGALELHIWGSRIDDIERPDRLVFDLDPSEELDFGLVKDAARHVRDVLDGLNLTSFPLVTGGKGMHVVAPLVRRHEWPVVKAFAEAIARRMADDQPDRYVAVMSKAKRKGRIFIDYLRNERGGTAIAPYSPRARKGAPVAWPVDWEDLAKVFRANQFRLADIDANNATGWAGYSNVRQSLKNASLEALGVEVS